MTNTALGHIALHFAKKHGKQLELKELIMKAHFVDAKHIGRLEQLVELGEQSRFGCGRDARSSHLG
jgi:predicted DsbA family dithiol-disulfide isomerase